MNNEKVMFLMDAAGDLSLDMIAGKPITLVPAKVHVDGKDYLDFVNLPPKTFWEMLKTCETPPTTSMAPPIEWMQACKRAHEQGYTHVCITTVSSTASGVMNAAIMGVDMLAAEGITDLVVEVVDTLAYTGMYGQAILQSVTLAEQGMPFQDIVARLKGIFGKVECLFSVYTLKYLKRSGRISGMAAFAGEALGIRPIMLASGGSINPYDKVRGDKNIIAGIMSCIAKRVDTTTNPNFAICHADVPAQDIDELVQKICVEYGVADIPRYPMGSSVTANVGPYCLAVTYYGRPRQAT